MNNPKYIIVHHIGGTESDLYADTSQVSFQQVNEYHRQLWDFKSKFGYYCGYHYFIDCNGNITQARDDMEEGAHCIGLNNSSIGICLAGNFDLAVPNSLQVNALKNLLARLSEKYKISSSSIFPHRQFSKKSCYGKRLSDDWARKLLFDFYYEKIGWLQQIILQMQNFIASSKVRKLGLLTLGKENWFDRNCPGIISL